jgi:3-deoxy-manno-octulosonate cytidylyltransferase (CMP-KDO synthetase)
MSFYVVIPARYASTRLPAKPLRMLGDKPMIQHVYERARRSGALEVIIATDEARI